jgi:hypothetical protein
MESTVQISAAVSLSRLPVSFKSCLAFTPFVVQSGETVVMFAARQGASMETMQLLLDSGAKASINTKDGVENLRSHLAV